MPKREKRKIPEVDDEFGFWTVYGQSYPGKAPSYNRKVPCICVCGKRRDIYYMNLLTDKSRSCGCQKRSMLKAKWKERKKKVK
jgi:hypothetical protein